MIKRLLTTSAAAAALALGVLATGATLTIIVRLLMKKISALLLSAAQF